MQYVSGSIGSGNVVLRSLGGGGQRVSMKGCSTFTISATGDSGCAGSNIILNASGANSYSWSNGATGSSITVSPSSTTTYTVTGVTGQCNNTASATATIVAMPSAPTASVTPPSCTLTTATITIGMVSGATYSFDNGATYQSSNVKSGLPANTNYNLTIKTSSGCVSAALTQNTGAAATSPAAPTATVTPATCTVSTATITIDPVTGATYSFDNGATYQASNVKSGLAANSTYNLKIKNSGGCISAALSKNTGAVSGTPPTATPPGNQAVCTGSTSTFSTVAGGAGPFTYQWYYSDNNGSSFASLAPYGNYPGNNTATMTTTDGAALSGRQFRVVVTNACGSVTSGAAVLTVTNIPAPYITLKSTTACNGSFMYFDDGVNNSSVTGEQYSYVFDYSSDNGVTWTNWANVKSGAARTGDYYGLLTNGQWKIRVTASNSCGTATAVSGTITVSSPSVPELTQVAPTCTLPTGGISVTAPASGIIYSLDGGAYGATSSWNGLGAGTAHTVTAQNAAGCSSAAASATIGAKPTSLLGTLTSSQTVCSLAAVTLTASGGSTYSWTSGSATGTAAGTTASISVLPSVATNYYVKISNGTCSGSASVLVQSPRPSLILTSVITICKGNTQDVIADNNGISGYTYRWLAPAGVLNVATPTLSAMKPLVTTGYTVERTTPNGCKDTATSTIKVYEQPVISGVSKTDAGCKGASDGTVTIAATSASGLVLEYSIDGNNWFATNVFSNLAPGAYSILVRNQNGVCQAVSGSNIMLGRQAGPQDTIKAQSVTCAFENVQFVPDPASAGATYIWSATGNPIIIGGSTSTTFVANWALPGVYQVTMTVTLNGCSTVRTKSINVSNAVQADAGADKLICAGGITRIGTAPQANVQVSYSWTPSTGLNDPTVAQPTASPLRSTTYTVTVTNPVTGCVRSDDVTVNVDVTKNPHADAGGSKSFLNVPGTLLAIGGPTTSPNPFQGSKVDYTWYGLVTDVAGDNLQDSYAPITNFVVPNGAADSYTYVLDVRKIVPAGTENGNSIFQYCHSYDTIVLSKKAALIVTVSGNLWDNTNGDNSIDAAAPLNEFTTDGGQALYAVLTDNTGKVVATAPIAHNGAYLFTGVPQNTTGLKVLISTLAPAAGTAFAASVAPANWVFLGSQSGTINSNTDKGNGYVSVNTGALNITGVNIGFDQLPVPVGATLPTQGHPAPGNPFVVSPALFTGTDAEDGTNINLIPKDSIRYTRFPTNVDSIMINGIVYTPARWPAAGVTVPVNTLVSVYPLPGVIAVTVPFKVIDQAGQLSPATANVVIPFKVVPYPDLTPVIELPSNIFDAGEVKDVVVYVEEILNFPTSNGTVAFNFTAPPGFQLQAYDGTLASVSPTGGALEQVGNALWSVVGTQNGHNVSLQAKAGVNIAGHGVSFVGFRVKRTTALPNFVSNLLVNIYADPSGTYDTNTANNFYNRVISAR